MSCEYKILVLRISYLLREKRRRLEDTDQSIAADGSDPDDRTGPGVTWLATYIATTLQYGPGGYSKMVTSACESWSWPHTKHSGYPNPLSRDMKPQTVSRQQEGGRRMLLSVLSRHLPTRQWQLQSPMVFCC